MPMPTILGRRWVPEKPGVMPKPTSGCPNFAFAEAILMSQHIESSQPPPSANPLMAAITGLSKSSIFLKTAAPFSPNALPCAAFMLLISEMSAPATNALPSPVRITARIESSAAISVNAQSSSPSTVELSAFNAWGLLILTMQILSCFSIRSLVYSI